MKKVIERILKVINIIINLAMGFIGVAAFMHYGINGYMYSDDFLRMIWMVVMMGFVNVVDAGIRKKIREF